MPEVLCFPFYSGTLYDSAKKECDHTELLREKITAEHLMNMAGKIDNDDLEDFPDDAAEEASLPPHDHVKPPRQVSDADEGETMSERRQPIWRTARKPALNASTSASTRKARSW